ncbi:MAG: BT_2262 family domain-containing protein [Bacteroidota bacterium]
MRTYLNQKYITGVVIVLFATVFLSCESEGDSVGISGITYFPTFEFAEGDFITIPLGTTFTPAAKVTEGDKELDSTIDNPVDKDKVGVYDVVYSALNSDGYSGTATQSVMVYDPDGITADLTGTYSGTVVRNGSEGYSDVPVTLTPLEGVPGVYTISDWIAGFYSDGRDYGSAYHFEGFIQITNTNEVLLLSMGNVWGDPFDGVVGTYDPGTKTISYTASWLGIYDFVVNITLN